MKRKNKIEYEKSFKDVLATNIDACEIQLFLASLGNDGITEIQLVQISSKLAASFREIVKENIEKKKLDLCNSNILIKSYDPQTKLDKHEIEVLNLSVHESIKKQLLGLSDVNEIEIFKEDTLFISNLRFYIIQLTPKEGEKILLFRTYTPKKELSRSKFFAVIFSEGVYDKYTNKLFLFDQYIDCIIRGDNLFIFNKDKFQKIFRFYEILLANAEQTLKLIQERIPIDDFSSFKESCKSHLQKLSKLKNIASKPYFSSLTVKKIRKIIKKYNLPIEIVGEKENGKIKYDSSDRWAILRLLDDDYLESLMTGNSYEVNSKRAIE